MSGSSQAGAPEPDGSPQPTRAQIEELVAYLPRLYAEGFEPVLRWHGGKPDAKGVWTLPYPQYNPVVEDFYRLATRWLDYGYNPEEAAHMLATEGFVQNATFAQIKTMLTYCIRGEHFSDGHWAEMIERGHIRRLLERLAQLASEPGTGS